MVFSSPLFLFLFLPVTLAVYFLLPVRLRNVWLLGTSLVFYGWGEPKFVVVMLASIVINFLLALWIEHRARDAGSARPALVDRGRDQHRPARRLQVRELHRRQPERAPGGLRMCRRS